MDAHILSKRLEAMQQDFERNEALQRKSVDLGIPGNTVLAGYILNLEMRLMSLEVILGVKGRQ